MKFDLRRLAPRRVAAGLARRAAAVIRSTPLARLEQRRDPEHPLTVVRALNRRNRWNRESVLGGGPIVTLTSHGARVDTVHLAIESIARGRTRPSELHLWLDDPNVVARPPLPIRRLMRRGLSVRLASNYGPHTKYYPYLLAAGELRSPVVTADDDILYPPHWLDDLDRANRSEPNLVHCHRAHRIPFVGERIAPYVTWPPCSTTEPSFLNFPTGVSGVVYPPDLLDYVRRQGTAFLEGASRADDVWLHKCAVSYGVPARQIRPESMHFEMIPGSQATALQTANVHGGENDQQIAATYSEADLAVLRSALAERAR